MSDYSFMKAGSGDEIQLSEKQIEEMQSLILLFAENTFKNAAEYVKHAKRNIIQLRDIHNCMKVEAMVFCQKDHTLQEAKKLLQEIKNEKTDEDDDDEEDDENDEEDDDENDEEEDDDENDEEDDENDEEEDEEEYTVSQCSCPLCGIIRDLDQYWDAWKPETPLEISLKKNIDKFNF